MNNRHVLHGSALCIFGYGVLISGDSGSGKTELAVSLIDRGHKFIADDNVMIDKITLNLIPAKYQFLHIGGLGFIDVNKTYGTESISHTTTLKIKIDLINEPLTTEKRLSNLVDNSVVFGHNVPSYKLYSQHSRPLALLVELIVKKQMQIDQGYDADNRFIKLSNDQLVDGI